MGLPHDLLRQLRLPRVRLLHVGAGAPDLLLQQPGGACPTCDGLGVQQYFDPAKLIHDPGQSLAGGAIRGWDKRSFYYFQMLKSLADHYKFDLETPWEDLPLKTQEVILRGSGRTEIEFRYMNDRGDVVVRKHPFEGILHNMERRYRETESNAVREELAKYIANKSCTSCGGSRLREEARHVFVDNRNLPAIAEQSIGDALAFFEGLNLSGQRAQIADKILKEIVERLGFLVNVGLNYLSLSRSAETLSGGEAQRIRLASQIGAGLVGVMYVLDEPSIGLHQRDNERLLKTLTHLRDLGNTVIVVEHDEDAIRLADHVLDIGPGAGVHGGAIVAQGTPEEIIANPESLTGDYLSGRKQIAIPAERTPLTGKWLKLKGASGNNLRNVNLDLPIGVMTCVTGVSGSGKSTLINDTLFRIAHRELNKATESTPAPYRSVEGLEHLDKVVDIDQSPIGRTPRSNPATYTGLFTPIRELLSGTQEARSRGYQPGRFSFNVKGDAARRARGWGHQGGDALPAGRLRAVRRLQGQALQPRDPGGEVQGQEHPRNPRDDGGRCPCLLRSGAGGGAQAADPDGRGPLLHPARSVRHHALWRRGAAGQAGAGALQAGHRPDPLHSG